MDLIHSRDIYYVTRDVLSGLDAGVMNHGNRTSYILYKMLLCSGQYEIRDIAKLCMVAGLHDIGAYKTDNLQDRLRYESKETLPHSIYGYLFLYYLTPLKEEARIILHHHTDHNRLPVSEYRYTDVTCYLNLAEKADIYSNALGWKFDPKMFDKQVGIKYSPKAMELLKEAIRKYNVIDVVRNGDYQKELDELFSHLSFSAEEKKNYLLGMMYCLGFRSEYTMLDMVTCVHIAEQLGEKFLLPREEEELLSYAAMLHDAGMCAVPKEIIEAPRKLTDEEMDRLRAHVSMDEKILKGRLEERCLEVILAHHERGDGSGYPKGLMADSFSRPAKILQVADTVTGLINPRSFREPRTKEEVISILNEEAAKGRLDLNAVRSFISFYDKIMDGVQKKNAETLGMYHKLQDSYELIYKQIGREK